MVALHGVLHGDVVDVVEGGVRLEREGEVQYSLQILRAVAPPG